MMLPVIPASLCTRAGALLSSTFFLSLFQSLLRSSMSALKSFSCLPSATVRTITPKFCGFNSETIFRSLFFSDMLDIFFDMPTFLLPGTMTTYRPGSEICVVSRGPLLAIGSFITWTRSSWPFLTKSAIVVDRRLAVVRGVSSVSSSR